MVTVTVEVSACERCPHFDLKAACTPPNTLPLPRDLYWLVGRLSDVEQAAPQVTVVRLLGPDYSRILRAVTPFGTNRPTSIRWGWIEILPLPSPDHSIIC